MFSLRNSAISPWNFSEKLAVSPWNFKILHKAVSPWNKKYGDFSWPALYFRQSGPAVTAKPGHGPQGGKLGPLEHQTRPQPAIETQWDKSIDSLLDQLENSVRQSLPGCLLHVFQAKWARPEHQNQATASSETNQ